MSISVICVLLACQPQKALESDLSQRGRITLGVRQKEGTSKGHPHKAGQPEMVLCGLRKLFSRSLRFCGFA